MAASYELAKGIYVTRDHVAALLKKVGCDGFPDHIAGSLVRCKPPQGATTTVGMVTGVQGLVASTQPVTNAQRMEDALDGSGSTVAVVPSSPAETSVELVKCLLVVAFSLTDKNVVGVADLSADAVLPEAEHAAFVARVSRGQQQGSASAGINLTPEYAAAVRLRLGRGDGVVPATVVTVPLDELVSRLQQVGAPGVNPGENSSALLRRISAERDAFRDLVQRRDSQLADSIASEPRRIKEATSKAEAEVARLQTELAAARKAVAQKDKEQRDLIDAVTTMNATVQLQSQRSKQLVDAVAAFAARQTAGGAAIVTNIDEATAWLASQGR